MNDLIGGKNVYTKYSNELKDSLLSDEINRLIVYGDDGEKVEYFRANSPSVQLIYAVAVIEAFLKTCKDAYTWEIITPDGRSLKTDWGYFEEGLKEIKEYAKLKGDTE